MQQHMAGGVQPMFNGGGAGGPPPVYGVPMQQDGSGGMVAMPFDDQQQQQMYMGGVDPNVYYAHQQYPPYGAQYRVCRRVD